MVWNSVVLEKLGHRSAHLLDARRAIRDGMDGTAAKAMLGLLDLLEQRKRAEAPGGLRLIGNLDAFVDEAGQLRVRATTVQSPSRN